MSSIVDRIAVSVRPTLYAIALMTSTNAAVADETWLEVASGIHVRVGVHLPLDAESVGVIANTGFIIGEETVAVIDPGGSEAAGKAMRKRIEATTDLPISHIVLTHFHPDHVFGAVAFDDIDAVVAHANHDTAKLQRAAFYGQRFGAALGSKGLAGLASSTIPIASGEVFTLDLGDRTVSVRAHRTGHTDNDISVFDENTKTLWASDLLFAQRLPSLDGSVIGWLEVMNELSSLQPDVVVPGHGEPDTAEAIVEPQRKYLEALVSATRRALRENVGLSEFVVQAESAPSGDWLLFTDQHPTNVTKAWSELEWD